MYTVYYTKNYRILRWFELFQLYCNESEGSIIHSKVFWRMQKLYVLNWRKIYVFYEPLMKNLQQFYKSVFHVHLNATCHYNTIQIKNAQNLCLFGYRAKASITSTQNRVNCTHHYTLLCIKLILTDQTLLCITQLVLW